MTDFGVALSLDGMDVDLADNGRRCRGAIVVDRWTATPRAGARDRLIAVAVAVFAGGMLVVAASLTPAADGHGTHEQLGLAPCTAMRLHHVPCPTCGMTTAFAWFVRGDLAAALRAQVLGTVLAAAALLAALGGLTMAVTGVHFGPALRRLFIDRLDWVWVLAVLAAGSWGLKAWLTIR